MAEIRMKSSAEILKRLRDLIHKHKKKFLKEYLEPCVENCQGAMSVVSPEIAEHLDYGEDKCTFCKTRGLCARTELFKPVWTKDEILEKFREDIKNPQKLPRDYRDVAILLWVLGMLDPEEVTNLESKKETDDKSKG